MLFSGRRRADIASSLRGKRRTRQRAILGGPVVPIECLERCELATLELGFLHAYVLTADGHTKCDGHLGGRGVCVLREGTRTCGRSEVGREDPGVTVRFRRFEPADNLRLERLNARLPEGDVHHVVYGEQPNGRSERRGPIRERLFVAVDDEIRGAIWLREHRFWVGEREIVAGWAKYPVSESLIDPRYSGVPAGLLFTLLREQPHLLALGLGGHKSPFARLLGGVGWKGSTVPFQFYPVRPGRVLRQLRVGKQSRLRRILLNVAAASGLAWVGSRLAGGWRNFLRQTAGKYDGTVVDRFGDWADRLWLLERHRYGFAAVRDSCMLNTLYPDTFKAITRLRVTKNGNDVGWVCTLRRDRRDGTGDPHFGNVALGLIADAFAAPEHALGVLSVGLLQLVEGDVDLVFSNQLHPVWVQALGSLGFLRGPSTFAFYYSPQATSLLHSDPVQTRGLYLNRGDCDGPRWT